MMTTTDEFHLWIVASLRTVCRVFGSCRTSGATFSADQCAAADGSFMGHLSDKPVIHPHEIERIGKHKPTYSGTNHPGRVIARPFTSDPKRLRVAKRV